MSGDVRERWKVVVNDEEQYSIWSAQRETPAGWREDGVHGTKDECLAHIERVWTDMRPRSLRERTAPEAEAR
ncbi:MbtH family protein [Streptomyces clavuligerus]|uniref:Tallysomycin Orf16-like MbtH domain protein n=1 Tax=Streptomyces clavuligerus TaxID=1901 RepID=B5H1G8_STRCL|nr:MbtH family NRPS accessory protein [Streptomyces clavuligerus]EDY52414.1 mbtH domain-containing protein [Streptomyces clavuligerus]EFG04779.1 Tallysomycin Orf16-like MbtH domain protein [Streptomyces clavuligerus]MBY6306773.1 MbtH family NRPS accessory protein [Streptomyces clavuligerus]QCS10624.1 MbtH family protein [Streptomyces clavuligerus]QPJ97338.1 MbtH family NRPS accessory protein [Streptomyces clavuligerus]